jgi:molecular chaperone GrpE (heat shock protein)
VSIPTDTITYRKRKTKVILIPNDAADKENSPGSMQSNSKTSGGKDEDAVKKVVVIEPSLEKSPESGDSSSSDDRSEKADEELVRLQQSLDELSLKIATKEAEVENYREMLAKSEVQSQEVINGFRVELESLQNRFQHEQDRAGSLAASIENYEVRIEEYSKLVDRNCDEKEKWKSQYLVLVQDSERIKQMTQTLKLENDNLKKQNANLMSLLAVSHQRRNEAEACEYLKSSSRFLTAQDNPEYILGFSEALESVFCETLSSSIADSLLWFRTSILHLLGKAGE